MAPPPLAAWPPGTPLAVDAVGSLSSGCTLQRHRCSGPAVRRIMELYMGLKAHPGTSLARRSMGRSLPPLQIAAKAASRPWPPSINPLSFSSHTNYRSSSFCRPLPTYLLPSRNPVNLREHARDLTPASPHPGAFKMPSERKNHAEATGGGPSCHAFEPSRLPLLLHPQAPWPSSPCLSSCSRLRSVPYWRAWLQPPQSTQHSAAGRARAARAR